MDALLRDARHALRALGRRPGYTVLALTCLALGIGATSAIFSVVSGVLLKPLAFPGAGRLVAVQSGRGTPPRGSASAPDFADLRAQSRTVDLAAYDRTSFNFRGAEVPEKLVAGAVSANFFRVLAVSPQLGRAFTSEEEQRGRGRVVMLSDGLWRRQFAGSPSVLGQQIRLDGEPYTVVGVMPRGFRYPMDGTAATLWVPMTIALDSAFEQTRGAHYLDMVGRLRPGATLARANAELAAVAHGLAERYPATDHGWSAGAAPLRDEIVGNARGSLLVLGGAVAFLLLIACANVANLMLARATLRAKEVALRTALGASRLQVVRHLMVEGVVLALGGGALGLLLGVWGTDALLAAAPRALPRAADIGLDWRVVTFTAVVSVVTGLLFAITPALQVTASDLNETLKEGGRSVAGGGSAHRLRSTLVVVEIALSLVLLTGAGLLAATVARLQGVDPGFDPHHVLAGRIALSGARYDTNAKTLSFFDQLLARVRALPGVRDAGLVTVLPLSGGNMMVALNLEGEAPPVAGGFAHAEALDVVSPGYFRAVGMRLVAGRDFTPRDDSAATQVMVVNESFARKYWPGQNPIGKRFTPSFSTFGDTVPPLRQVVGVVDDIRRGALDEPVRPAMYAPEGQAAFGSLWIALRASGDPAALAGPLRRAVLDVDPDEAVSAVAPMEQVLERSLSHQRFNATLLGIFAVVALALSAVGIYGVMSSMVVQRRRELAVRMALGARREDVLRLVMRQGGRLTLLGVALGLAGALAITRLLAGLLYGVGATDPTTFIAVSLVLAAVALAASWLPARRATRVDPLLVLQGE